MKMMMTGVMLAALAASGMASGAPAWHVTGGTERFRSFLRALQADGGTLRTYPSVTALPFETATTNDVFFILPEYEKGESVVHEPDFESLDRIAPAMRRGSGFYFENYAAPEYSCDRRHSDLTHLQVVGRPRNFFQEYVVWKGQVLQARDAFYVPSSWRDTYPFAVVSDCSGTHRVSVKGKWRHPAVSRGLTPRVAAAAMDLSRYDPLFRRPVGRWRDFFVETFAPVTGLDTNVLKRAFDACYPEPVGLRHGREAAEAVKRAVGWHFDSGILRARDGSKGIFEMIRSDDLGVRRSLRTDAGLLSGALMVDAGRKYGNAEWERVGRTLVDFLLDRGVQTDAGFFRWYENCDQVWASDSSRCGLAMVNLWKVTGDERYHARARRLGDAFLSWLGDEHICGGYFDIPAGMRQHPVNDNPVFYGEMVSFLLQLGERKYVDAAVATIERVMAKFPDVTPFGFSDNFTYSRCLLMLSCAQYASGRDYSDRINRLLDFFLRLRHPCGGLCETAIRLEDHTEAGVGMGDGSDRIADNLYCNNFVFGAVDVLTKLPPERRGTVDLAEAKTLKDGLRRYFLDTQIASADKRIDGGWMRAYDMDLGAYYGLNRDMDWGSYCIMGGWVMGFVPAVLMHADEPTSWYVNGRTAARQ